MPKKPKVIVLRTAGTNCDEETVFAFQQCGADVDSVHIKQLCAKEISLHDYHILAIPGGFTYGDDIESGRILANELRVHLGGEIRKFIDDGKLIIGICNGFQVLVKAGILPGNGSSLAQSVSLTFNNSNKFEARWSYLKPGGQCVWTEGIDHVVYFPVAHAEGKFVTPDDKILRKLIDRNQIVFSYCEPDGADPDYPDNPNGSYENIAGITDPTGRILGLMPHPERHFLFNQHPSWTRLKKTAKFGDGARIFQNGVDYVKRKFK